MRTVDQIVARVAAAQEALQATTRQLTWKMELHTLTAKNLKEIAASDWPGWMKQAAAAAVESRHTALMEHPAWRSNQE